MSIPMLMTDKRQRQIGDVRFFKCFPVLGVAADEA